MYFPNAWRMVVLPKHIHMTKLTSKLISAIILTGTLLSCKKDSTTADTSSSPIWKGFVNNSVWEHGVILRSNGTARYFMSFSGGSMSDTANANMGKYEGTYNQTATDSIYINCADATNSIQFRLRGRISGNSMSGTWVNEAGGITNTLPFSMTK
jgi:hypothetical protein